MRVELELDEMTYRAILDLAAAQNSSVGQVVAELLSAKLPPQNPNESIVGLFGSNADLIDEVCALAMTSREQGALRLN
ncbi:MAG: hypothetical protein HY706_09505 [Candidatus Hydrogenedentes bacterium]|nr:hypothetical protein [Candidatus Hydrogenedentota bacterium]